MFQATNYCTIVGANNKLVWDTMVTGRKKSFLLSSKDQVKIDKYIKEFERLKIEFRKHDINVLPISAVTGIGLEELINRCRSMLGNG